MIKELVCETFYLINFWLLQRFQLDPYYFILSNVAVKEAAKTS